MNRSKNIPQLLIASLSALASVSVSAIEFRDIDKPGLLLSAGGSVSSYTGDFNLVTGDGDGTFTIGAPYLFGQGTFSDVSGFDPATMDAFSGRLSLYIRDDLDLASEAFIVDLGSLAGFITASNFATVRYDSPGLPGEILVSINDTGHLSYTVTATGGDFILDYAMLTVEARSSVPDGATTAWLFGFAFVSLAVCRQRFVKPAQYFPARA